MAETELEFGGLGLGGKGDSFGNELNFSLGQWKHIEGLI